MKPWELVLHWSGTACLLIGILLAAEGIAQVRREWTLRPGIWGTIQQSSPAIRGRAALVLWRCWNRVVQWDWLARLNLHRHEVVVRVYGSDAAHAEFSAIAGSADVIWGQPPATSTTEERLKWLEQHVADAGQQLRTLNAWRVQDVSETQAATEEERAARIAEDQRIAARMANLAGGGLRLQTWGVAFLLAGTIMTAIW